MTGFLGFIDPPGAFADADEWRAHVEELGRLDPSPEVDRAIVEARFGLMRAVERAPAPTGEEDDFSDLEGEGGGEG